MITNPALTDLRFLAGSWDMELSQAEVTAGRAEIDGSWQKSVDGGATWEHDFAVRYRRAGPPDSRCELCPST